MEIRQVKNGDKLYHKKWSFIDYGIVFGLEDNGKFYISHLNCGMPQYDDSLWGCHISDIGKTLFWSEEEADQSK
jgi:hypothetical protein